MKQREITLYDWSNRSEENQHLLFLVAYRLIVLKETKRLAMETTAATTGVNLNRIRNLVSRFISVNFREEEDPTPPIEEAVTE